MFQSVTYTGFEKHPERKAWVEGVVMPFVAEVFRNETEGVRAYWHDPDLQAADTDELAHVVCETVVPELGDAPLVGSFFGRGPAAQRRVIYPGVLLVVVSSRITSGWTYLPLPETDGGDMMWLRWGVRSLYLAMLSDSMDRRQKSYRDDPVTVGGDDADPL